MLWTLPTVDRADPVEGEIPPLQEVGVNEDYQAKKETATAGAAASKRAKHRSKASECQSIVPCSPAMYAEARPHTIGGRDQIRGHNVHTACSKAASAYRPPRALAIFLHSKRKEKRGGGRRRRRWRRKSSATGI